MKIDFHVHTKYSHDCSAQIGEILQYAKRHGLDAIAIADHDSLEGSREARKMRTANDVEVIPAIELTLPAGDYGLHIVALNMDEYICFNDIAGAIEQLKNFGATIVLPHPFRNGTGLFALEQQGDVSDEDVQFVLENIDYVEALNLKDNCAAVEKTLQYVAQADYPIISGTDAHCAEYVGMTYTTISNLECFLNGTEKGVVEAFVKRGSAAELSDLHSILETGNDSHYMNRKSNSGAVSLLKAFRNLSSNGRSDKKAGRFRRCAEIAGVFRDSSPIGLKRVDDQLQLVCGSQI